MQIDVVSQMKESRHSQTYATCWCGCVPTSPYWAMVWGGILTLSGIAWLLFNLNLITLQTLELSWPISLIAVGFAHLGWVLYDHNNYS